MNDPIEVDEDTETVTPDVPEVCEVPTLVECEAAVGEPATAWGSRCHEIATKIVGSGLVPGAKAVYGLWIGPISPQSTFRARPFTHHGWIRLPDGSILDPTRWAFEAVEPYLYHGPNDHYDPGGNKIHRLLFGEVPPYDPEERQYEFTQQLLSGPAWTLVEKLVEADLNMEQEPGTLCMRQVAYLANLPPALLNEHAKEIYRALEQLGCKAFIGIDNWKEVME
jgi:hypothetical protein